MSDAKQKDPAGKFRPLITWGIPAIIGGAVLALCMRFGLSEFLQGWFTAFAFSEASGYFKNIEKSWHD